MKKLEIKRHISFFCIFGLFISFQPSAQAATTFQISFLETMSDDETYLDDYGDFETSSYLRDSTAAKKAKSEFSRVLKANKTLKWMESLCRKSDYFGARIKVTTSSGSTAGLGNLNNFVVKNIHIVEHLADLPNFTEAEEAQREAAEEAWNEEQDASGGYEDWPDPDYVEEGYSYWTPGFDCIFNSKVIVTNSNAYTVFVDGKRGPEYTRAELSKMKWRLTLVEN